MKRLLAVLCFAAVLVPAASSGASAAGAPTIVMPDAGTFAPAPAPYPQGATMAVLSGDPSGAGSQYAVRLKLPDTVRIAPHTHGDMENVTVVSGTLMVGVGSTFDAAHMLALPAGSYVSIPAGTPHFAMAKGDTLLQINGVGPASITSVR